MARSAGTGNARALLTWLDRYQQVVATAEPQKGEASHYRRRGPADSELNPHSTLAEQLELLRVVDNQFYPAFFNMRGRRYELMIRSSQFVAHSKRKNNKGNGQQ